MRQKDDNSFTDLLKNVGLSIERENSSNLDSLD